jgi:hypothetical protein
MNTTVGALPWYKSPVMIGAVVTIISTLAGLAPKAFAAVGLNNPTAIETTVASAFQIFALLAGVFTAVKRTTSAVQPLTASQAGADAHPATMAVIAATAPPREVLTEVPIAIKPPAVIPGKPWGKA